MRRLLFFLVTCFLFASCSHYHDDPSKSVWSGGLWLIFWLPFLGSLVFAYYAYKAHESGQMVRKSEFEEWKPGEGKVPYYKIGQFWFFVILQLAAWIICYIVNHGR